MLEQLAQIAGAPYTNISTETGVLRMLAAMILGGMIGFERETHSKEAGLRTHILISLAACLFTLVAFDLVLLPAPGEADLHVDPLRLVEAVTTGVAFLAAGTIITRGTQVRGLTTGAGMWMAGAIGLACGIGNLRLAGLATMIALLVLWVMRVISRAVGDDGESAKSD
ncbi:hypothetical protein DEA8626_00283 [Defluviimonas aquaemixtae]|uniref:Protein MgtC n=1 Tax=Albidovulum aquaemixtae TaxID=1542388 RepID=A0A2R8B2I3_9RHOB|nr:MgtC/SapB family protein [Defluviimonas aquaemixtae]SPH16772.1 hypothetical protein DEA8626_00283 [Defluviimonas aquaemixtae]